MPWLAASPSFGVRTLRRIPARSLWFLVITRRALVGLTLPLVACGSGDGPPTQPLPDTIPPNVQITYPVDSIDEFNLPATDYDETGNGLMDVRVTWSDAGDGVDPSTARIEVLGAIAGSAGSGDDLSGLWTQIERDAAGLSFEETIEQLVRHGSQRLVASVADSAGNRGADTLQIHLRYGDFHRSIALNYEPGAPTGDVMVCEDDGRLYLVRTFAVMVLDASTFEMIGTFPTVLAEPPARVLCVPGDPILYATVRVNRFNRTTLQWRVIYRVRSKLTRSSNHGSIRRYCGRAKSAAAYRNGWIGSPTCDWEIPLHPCFPSRPSATSSCSLSLCWTVTERSTTAEHLRPVSWSAIRQPASNSRTDDRFIYAALQGLENGLVEVATETDQATRRITSIGGLGIDVAINPAGDRLWLTTQDIDPAEPSASLLIDPARWEVVQQFPRPVAPGTQTRWVLAATFHPNGKLLFQARDDDIDVYLIR